MNGLIESNIFTFIVLPLLIMIARIFDVTLGTIRIMFVSRGNKIYAPILGFFEILIWLIAIRQIMVNLENVLCYIGYAGGFSIGNFLGIKIEEKLSYGKVIIRIITRTDSSNLVKNLRQKGFGITVIDAEGSSGRVKVIYTIIDRVNINKVITAMDRFNPKAFYSTEDVRSVKAGIFPSKKNLINKWLIRVS